MFKLILALVFSVTLTAQDKVAVYAMTEATGYDDQLVNLYRGDKLLDRDSKIPGIMNDRLDGNENITCVLAHEKGYRYLIYLEQSQIQKTNYDVPIYTYTINVIDLKEMIKLSQTYPTIKECFDPRMVDQIQRIIGIKDFGHVTEVIGDTIRINNPIFRGERYQHYQIIRNFFTVDLNTGVKITKPTIIGYGVGTDSGDIHLITGANLVTPGCIVRVK